MVRRRIHECAALAQDEQYFTIFLLRNGTRYWALGVRKNIKEKDEKLS
jgi:hypothetical protein